MGFTFQGHRASRDWLASAGLSQHAAGSSLGCAYHKPAAGTIRRPSHHPHNVKMIGPRAVQVVWPALSCHVTSQLFEMLGMLA
jgi:hypothetical protein